MGCSSTLFKAERLRGEEIGGSDAEEEDIERRDDLIALVGQTAYALTEIAGPDG